MAPVRAVATASAGTTSREREGTKLVEAVDRVAPGLREHASSTCTCRPRSTSSASSGLRNGQVMHVEMAFDQMFMWRPDARARRLPRSPASTGLYLCGASTHPGGGVFGASGRSAARAALADRSPSFLQRVVKEVRRA